MDLKTRKCNITNTRSWYPYGVPPGSRFRAEGTIGAVGFPNEEVPIAIFTGEFDDRGL